MGDGKDILFGHDNWVTNENLLNLLKIDTQDLPDSNIKVSAFIENNSWNIPKLSQQIRDQDIVRRITGIPLPISHIKDSFHWGLSSTGCFTTKLAIWSSLALIPEDDQWPYKWIWKVDTMPKIKIFLCQMCHNALPVRGTLVRRGCQLDPHYPLCLNEIETFDHLFSTCSHTNLVWEVARLHNWIRTQTILNQSVDWLSNLHVLNMNCQKKTLHRISFSLWSIWKMRNAVIFHQVRF